MRPLLLLFLALPCLLVHTRPAEAANMFGIENYGQRTLSERLQTLGRSVDADSDGEITAKEMARWVKTLKADEDEDSSISSDSKDSDEEDNCVSEEDWVAGLVKAGFTEEIAQNTTVFLSQQPGFNTAECPDGLDTEALEASGTASGGSSSGGTGATGATGGTASGGSSSGGTGATGATSGTASSGSSSGGTSATGATIAEYPRTVDDFMDWFLREMAQICEMDLANGDDHYLTNTDCSSLPLGCATEPFGCRPVCLEYTFVTTAGRTSGPFAERAQHRSSTLSGGSTRQDFSAKLEAMFQDADEDGIFTQEEQADDYRDHYDTNADGCVDEGEYKARMSTALCGGFDFSEKFAEEKFEALKAANGNCVDMIDATVPNGTHVSEKTFTNENTQILVDMCEGDETLYSTNGDCEELTLACKVQEKTSETKACREYLEPKEDDDDQDDRVDNTAIKFFNFLKKWGESYEDFFGNNK